MPIHYETHDHGHVVLITIDRPEARNSLDLQHFSDLAKAWRRFGDDDDAWVAIITGVDDAFCAGADLKTFIPQITELQQKIREQGVDEVDGIKLSDSTDAVLRNAKLYKPIIAAVNGHCVAGGMEMLGGVDIRIATRRHVRGDGAQAGPVRRWRHHGPPAPPARVPPRDGVPAHRRGASRQRCYEMGLINEIVDRDKLMERAFGWARRITANAPLAVQATKESVMRGLAADSLDDAYGSRWSSRGSSSPPRTPRKARGLRREAPAGLAGR
jgi:enoyl-CoA hydratase